MRRGEVRATARSVARNRQEHRFEGILFKNAAEIPSVLVEVVPWSPIEVVCGSPIVSASSYSVGEGAGTATITVSRTGGSGGAVSADYATANGAATAGSDYTATSGTFELRRGGDVEELHGRDHGRRSRRG